MNNVLQCNTADFLYYKCIINVLLLNSKCFFVVDAYLIVSLDLLSLLFELHYSILYVTILVSN